MYSEAGKDHFRRPSKISDEELKKRWEETFKKEKERKKDPPKKIKEW